MRFRGGTRLRHVGNGLEQLASEWADREPMLCEQRAPVRLGLGVHVHEPALARLRRGEHDDVAETGETLDDGARCASQMLGDLDAESEVEATYVGHPPLQVRAATNVTAELRTRDCGPTPSIPWTSTPRFANSASMSPLPEPTSTTLRGDRRRIKASANLG